MGKVVDRFDELGLCRVCALALPRNADGDVCSRRCAGLRKRSAAALGAEAAEWRRRVLDVLAELQKSATTCPGALSQSLLPELDKPLTVLRPLLYQMAEEGKVVLSQKGLKTPWWKIRGPFRIRRA